MYFNLTKERWIPVVSDDWQRQESVDFHLTPYH